MCACSNAKAGTQGQSRRLKRVWVPACAGMNGGMACSRDHVLCLCEKGEANAMLAPVCLFGRGGSPVFLYLYPRHEGDGAPQRRMAWISPDRPDSCRASPERRALTLMTRAPAP